MSFNFLATPRIICQSGRRGDLDTPMKALSVSRPLIISKPGIFVWLEAMLLGAALAGMAFINASASAFYTLSYPLVSLYLEVL